MNLYKKTGIIAGLILLMAYFAYSIFKKESTLKNGQLVLLQLAPVDPRSLMQGDYMRLNYVISSDFSRSRWAENITTVTPSNSSDSIVSDSTNAVIAIKDSFNILPGLYEKLTDKGYLLLKIDANGVAHLRDVQAVITPCRQGEVLVKYKHYTGDITIGAESYFFEEGKAQKFDSAKYGGLRVDANGNSILVGLYDEKHQLITP